MPRTRQRGIPDLGERMRQLMDASNLNASQLSARADISVSYLTRILRGEVLNPTIDFIIRIAAGLGVTVSELVGEGLQHRQNITSPISETREVEILEQLQELKTEVRELREKIQEPVGVRASQEPPFDDIRPSVTQGLYHGTIQRPARLRMPVGVNAVAFIKDTLPGVNAALQAQGANEWWFKGGLPTDTLPADKDWYQAQFSRTFTEHQAKEVLVDRVLRTKTAQQRVASGVEQKYIIPRSAIERYVREGTPNRDEYESYTDPNWRADKRERIERIQNLIWFLEHSNYHLALCQGDFFPIWWGIYNQNVVILELFFDLSSGQIIDGLTVRIVSEKSDDHAEMVKRFISHYRQFWEDIPSEAKENERTTEWLRSLLAKIAG